MHKKFVKRQNCLLAVSVTVFLLVIFLYLKLVHSVSISYLALSQTPPPPQTITQQKTPLNKLKIPDTPPISLLPHLNRHSNFLEFPNLSGLNVKFHPNYHLIAGMKGLSDAQLENWDLPQIKIHVITQNRLYSLQRLCDSLLSAKYFGSRVDLAFHVEADANQETVDYVNAFEWAFGDLHIHQRIQTGGLMAAIVESWYPLSDDEYAIFLEDDIEVSPWFYFWAKWALLNYRYTDSSRLDSMFGISLYTARIQELTWPRQFLHLEKKFAKYPKNSPFLWQLPCSWGALYYPEKWREFTHYIRARLLDFKFQLMLPDNITQAYPDFPSSKYEVFIPNSRSNVWSQSWKKYFMEMISLRGYMMLYPNFPNQTSFSTNHLEPGTHISVNSKARKRIDEYRVPLIINHDEMQRLFKESEFPSLNELAILDPFAVETTVKKIKNAIFSVVLHKPQQKQETS